MDRRLGLQEVEPFRTYRQLAYEGSKFVSPKHRSPLPAIPGTHFRQKLIRPQRHSVDGSNKLVTTSGILTEAFQLIVQSLNQIRHRVFVCF